MQVGFWKAEAWKPAWGLEVVQRFKACMDSPTAHQCRMALVEGITSASLDRHHWGSVPAHLMAHEEWRRQRHT